jgi:SAM-dependent methyltransferase
MVGAASCELFHRSVDSRASTASMSCCRECRTKGALINYDAELQLHNERLRAAHDIGTADYVLDIGCGTGQSTREAARIASDGMALGVDVDEAAIGRARALADLEGLPNARFEHGDVQVYAFRAGEFDVAISRFGTMFFDDPRSAFRNVARAMRARARLVMMVWQVRDRNEWAVSIDRALGHPRGRLVHGLDPFSLGEPTTVRSVLSSAGFTAVTLTDVDVPVFYGRDVDAALDFVGRFTTVSRVLLRSDPPTTACFVEGLRSTLAAHTSEQGVWFDSRAWIVRAQRR